MINPDEVFEIRPEMRFDILLINVCDPGDPLARHVTCESAGWNEAGEFTMHRFIQMLNGKATSYCREWREVGPWNSPFVMVKVEKHGLGLVSLDKVYDRERDRIDVQSITAAGYSVMTPFYEQWEEGETPYDGVTTPLA